MYFLSDSRIWITRRGTDIDLLRNILNVFEPSLKYQREIESDMMQSQTFGLKKL